ncbi:hypothetical protein Caur_3660 [Chloroflexus aurantiacus J-10-fl]|uniref:Uncharacterized protein n=1 Tax=Chloroflexus aurantiacus (strain ATCC 29366 / DSM 635 / J-10-fl) TaxID=324602 RepID=A9WB50_CHLAA|nr:hypothetical protein Caur_3660 [Chloroflexus aurantiacus J-10-fl]
MLPVVPGGGWALIRAAAHADEAAGALPAIAHAASSAGAAQAAARGGAGVAEAATTPASAAVGTLAEPRRAPDFVVTPHGEAIPVPDGAVGPLSTRAPGFQYIGGSGGKGLDQRVSAVRIMDANQRQGRRVVYMNERDQRVNPYTGRTISKSDPLAHLYLKDWE